MSFNSLEEKLKAGRNAFDVLYNNHSDALEFPIGPTNRKPGAQTPSFRTCLIT